MKNTRTRRLLVAVLACGLLAVVTGCAASTTPELPLGDAQPPLPVGAQNPAELPETNQQPPCDDPTASYPASDLSIPSGSSMAKIKSHGKLVVGVDQNTYLFGYRDPSTNDLSGFDVALAREVAKAIFGDPNKIQYKAISSGQRIPFVKEGKVDMVVRTMTMNCARWEEVAFSTEYFRAHQQIAVYGDHPVVEKLDDLGGQRVCAAIGSTSILKIDATPSKPIAVAVPEWTDCLVMLQQGTVDAISTDNVILAGFAAQDSQVKLSKTSLSEEPYGIAINLDRKDLVRYVNAVLENVRNNGTWNDLYQATDRSGNSLKSLLGATTAPAPKYRE